MAFTVRLGSVAARQPVDSAEQRRGQRGNGRRGPEALLRDRARIDLGICAAIQDVLVVEKALAEAESQNRKTELDRMAAMLSRLGGRRYQVREASVTYGPREAEVDPDPDSDSDLDESKPQPAAGGD